MAEKKSSIARLRQVALLEGVSFLVLVFVAMPLKYAANMPWAVKITGWVHGALFVALCWLLLLALMNSNWPFKRAVIVFVAALLPFGPFVLDRKMAAWETEE